MEASKIKEEARLLIAREADIVPTEIKDDTNLRRLPGMGLGRVLQVVGRLEREHGIALKDEHLYDLKTLDDLERAVGALQGTAATSAAGSDGTARPGAVTSPSATGSLAGWERSLDQLIAIPEEYVRYTVSVPAALALLRTDRHTLDHMVERGLRCADTADGPLFDENDLYNLAMYSGTGRSIPEVAVRYNIRLARSSPKTWERTETWRIRHFATCPEHGRCDEPWELVPVIPEPFGGELLELTHDVGRDGPQPSGEVAGRPAFMMRDCVVQTVGRRMELRSPVLKDAYQAELEDFRSGRIRFQSLPSELRTDAHKARAIGAGNCISTSIHLAEVLRDAGFEARTRKGYYIAVGAEDHGWVEVFEEGQWKALDPALAVLAEFDLGVEKAAAFTEFCAGSYLSRFVPGDCAADEEMVRHRHGDQEFAEVPTTIVARTAAKAGRKG